MASSAFSVNPITRYWTYQKERFPLVTHAPLIVVVTAACLTFSAALSGSARTPRLTIAGAIFGITFIFFLLLRIADEIKDYEDDVRFRSYRAVPRGLVTLSELRSAAVLGIVLQLVLAAVVDPALVVALGVVLGYLGLMTKEFFAREWLKAHPLVYLASHMVILPLIALFATAGDWLIWRLAPPREVGLLALTAFLVGIVLEIGRKIRAPEDEERGVDTYSALWGGHRAAHAWLVVVVATAVSASLAARVLGAGPEMALALLLPVSAAAMITGAFCHPARSLSAQWFEHLSGAIAFITFVVLAAAGTLGRLV